jgi:membrane protein implicated in regulation of membrane protease activity
MAPVLDTRTSGPIRPSRFIAGIALHLAIPAYFIWLGVALLPQLTGSSRDQLATAIGRTSLQFLIIYIIVVIALTLATRALEPTLREARERREARDPRTGAQQSKQRVGAALRAAASLGNGRSLLLAIQRLDAVPWNHDDPRFQTLSTDLDRTANAFKSALDGAPAANREDLQDLAATTFDRIASAAEQLVEEQRQLDHGDARTIARYIELRYPSSDFASEQNN